MSTRIATYDLDGSERVHDLPWMRLAYTHVLNGPGSAEIDVAMSKVARADIEPGQTDYRIYQDETLTAEGRIWSAEPNTNYDEQVVKLIGEGIAGILARRLIEWDVYYVLSTETGLDPDEVTMTQQDILFDTVGRSQAELAGAGDLGITQGTHTGDDHERHRRYCREDLIYCSEVFEDFAGLSNGLDWALTPTLTDSSRRELLTWNPKRGSALDGSIVLDGTDFLDDFTYAIDASQIVTRGRAAGEGDQPAEGDAEDAGAVATYGLLERGEQSQSPRLEDADETAEELISPLPLVAADVTYRLSVGPAIGDFDCGDYIAVVSSRPGWELTVIARVQEIQVIHEFPSYDDDDHTFVRVNWTEVGESVPVTPPGGYTATPLDFLSGGSDAAGNAINDDGLIAGVSDDGADYFGVTWSGTTPTALDGFASPASPDVQVSGINASGQVSGQLFGPSGAERHAVRWDGTTPTELDLPGGATYAGAGGINDTAQVAGWAVVSGAFVPVVWDDTTPTVLTDLAGGDGNATLYDINASGEACGSSVGSGDNRPVIWDSGGTPAAVGLLSGGSNGGVTAINDSGVSCGTSDATDGFTHAVRWTSSIPAALGFLAGGSNAYAAGINASGVVCGSSDAGDGFTHAVVWAGTTAIALPFLDGGDDAAAQGINAGGQIVGYSNATDGFYHAVLWDPA